MPGAGSPRSENEIFISYSSDDASRVRVFVKALEAEGWKVFWDQAIPYGEDWESHIGTHLDAALLVLVIWSNSSIKSRFVKEEANRALKRNVLLPVQIDSVDQPFGFGHINVADLVEWFANGGGPLPARLRSSILRKVPLPSAREPIASRAGQREPDPSTTAAVASKFSETIQAFLEEYLVTETGAERIPFGGRGKELENLDRWLQDPSSPSRLVLVGPAGRGKSALLVNWTKRLTLAAKTKLAMDAWHVVFVPISIRFNTNRPSIFYEAIAARLAEIVETELRPPQTDPAAYYEDQCRRLLRLAMAQGRHTLIIVDGADEALGSGFEARWFPRKSGGTLRIVVSARLQVGDVDAQGWVRRLGWESGVRYTALELPSLDILGVKNLLATSGAPLDELAARPRIVDRLHQLSEGEPLVLRLYVEDLWLRTDGNRELTVDDLERIKPGISGYFQDWLTRQQDAWKKEGSSIDLAVLRVQLALLACAYGPLSAENIGSLLRLSGFHSDGLRIEDGLYPLRRFIIGAGKAFGTGSHGYVLSHPRFGQYLRENYLDDSTVVAARTTFAQWGSEVVRRANDSTLQDSQIPSYVLNYHGQHLLDAGYPSELFLAMVEPGWLRARQAREGGYRGFSEDVAVAMNALLSEQPRNPNWRSSLVRCALFQSSIASLVSQTPEELLIPSVQAGVMSARQVLHWLDFHSEEVRCRTLVQLSPHLDDTNMAPALEACRAIRDNVLRARSLAAVANRASNREEHAIAAEALSHLVQTYNRSQIVEPWNCKLVGDTLISLAKYLDQEEIDQAAAVARSMSYTEDRVLAFRALALVTTTENRAILLRQALSALSGVRAYDRRYSLTSELMAEIDLELLLPFVEALCMGEEGEKADRPVMAALIDELLSQLPILHRTLAFEAAIRLQQPGRYKIVAYILRQLPTDQHFPGLLSALASIDTRAQCFRFFKHLADFFTPAVMPPSKPTQR